MNRTNPFDIDPVRLFGDYMKITGAPTLAPACGPDPKLAGKNLGVINSGQTGFRRAGEILAAAT